MTIIDMSGVDEQSHCIEVKQTVSESPVLYNSLAVFNWDIHVPYRVLQEGIACQAFSYNPFVG